MMSDEQARPMDQETWGTYEHLAGRSVIVTGGATGIGAEIVIAFYHQGCRVGFLDLNEAGAREIQDRCPGVLFAHADLRNIASEKQALEYLIEGLGGVDVLVNNAANDDRHDWQDVTPDYWDERFATNLRHQFFAIQACAPHMSEAGRGSIINIGSNSWWEAGGGFPAYATAKSAVHGLTRTMARDLGIKGIRVNTVVPGWIMTQRQRDLWVTEDALAKQTDRQCIHEPIEPVYVARMCVFLASDDAGMCTAGNFMVDGGSI